MNARLAHCGIDMGWSSELDKERLPNGLEMSRPASSSIVSQTRFAAAGRVGSIELLGSS